MAESLDRRLILDFVVAAPAAPGGHAVLDAGAGSAPYAELFSHCDYVTTDWSESIHARAHPVDVIASLDDLPFETASFDAVLITQVLEHVPNPTAVLRELRRILVPGGKLWLTAPFVGELHAELYVFFRYTPYSLRTLVEAAGFGDVDVHALGGYFTTLAELLRNYGGITGRTGQGVTGSRIVARRCGDWPRRSRHSTAWISDAPSRSDTPAGRRPRNARLGVRTVPWIGMPARGHMRG